MICSVYVWIRTYEVHHLFQLLCIIIGLYLFSSRGNFPLQSYWSLSFDHGLNCSDEVMWKQSNPERSSGPAVVTGVVEPHLSFIPYHKLALTIMILETSGLLFLFVESPTISFFWNITLLWDNTAVTRNHNEGPTPKWETGRTAAPLSLYWALLVLCFWTRLDELFLVCFYIVLITNLRCLYPTSVVFTAELASLGWRMSADSGCAGCG